MLKHGKQSIGARAVSAGEAWTATVWMRMKDNEAEVFSHGPFHHRHQYHSAPSGAVVHGIAGRCFWQRQHLAEQKGIVAAKMGMA